MKAISLVILTGVAMVGCASQPVTKPTPSDTPSLVDQKITEISVDIQKNLRRLADTNNALAVKKMTSEQRRYANQQALYIPKGLEKPVSITWDGPIEPLLVTLTNQVGYKFKVNGKRPTPNVMVRTYATEKPIIDLLRDVGLQAGEKATVRIIESGKILELNYADR